MTFPKNKDPRRIKEKQRIPKRTKPPRYLREIFFIFFIYIPIKIETSPIHPITKNKYPKMMSRSFILL